MDMETSQDSPGQADSAADLSVGHVVRAVAVVIGNTGTGRADGLASAPKKSMDMEAMGQGLDLDLALVLEGWHGIWRGDLALGQGCRR
jgi:hypothetical protein